MGDQQARLDLGLAGCSEPVKRLLEQLEKKGCAPRRKGRGAKVPGWLAACPMHGPEGKRLSIGEGREGRVLLRCWEGCPTQAVLDALGLKMSDLFGREPSA